MLIAVYVGFHIPEWAAIAALSLALFFMIIKGLIMLADRVTIPKD